MSTNPYPNSWWVARHDEQADEWRPELGSVGNKSYAMGYINALETFYPRPSLRLMNDVGKVAKELSRRDPPNLRTRDYAPLTTAARSALTELLYLAEQVKAREGGSVRRAIAGLQSALGGNGIPSSPAVVAGALDDPAGCDWPRLACPECGGRGWNQAGGPDFANLYQEKCEACDGTGEMQDRTELENRLLSILKAALAQSGCDGDLCFYEWHEQARRAIAEAEASC